MEWDKELADFEVLQVLKEGYKETKDGKNLLQNIRDQAAPIVGRIGLNTSDDKGEQSGDRKQLAKWYDEIYYAKALSKLLIFTHPSTHNLNKRDVINRLIDAKVGFPLVHKWLKVFNFIPPTVSDVTGKTKPSIPSTAIGGGKGKVKDGMHGKDKGGKDKGKGDEAGKGKGDDAGKGKEGKEATSAGAGRRDDGAGKDGRRASKDMDVDEGADRSRSRSRSRSGRGREPSRSPDPSKADLHSNVIRPDQRSGARRGDEGSDQRQRSRREPNKHRRDGSKSGQRRDGRSASNRRRTNPHFQRQAREQAIRNSRERSRNRSNGPHIVRHLEQ